MSVCCHRFKKNHMTIVVSLIDSECSIDLKRVKIRAWFRSKKYYIKVQDWNFLNKNRVFRNLLELQRQMSKHRRSVILTYSQIQRYPCFDLVFNIKPTYVVVICTIRLIIPWFTVLLKMWKVHNFILNSQFFKVRAWL